MNLQNIAVGYISAVNPQLSLSVKLSTGYTENSEGAQIPSYASPVSFPGQVQPLSQQDLRQLDALNIQGSQMAIYVNGALNGVVRSEVIGGDLIIISSGPSAGTYLVTANLEKWPDWCKVAVTLQNGA